MHLAALGLLVGQLVLQQPCGKEAEEEEGVSGRLRTGLRRERAPVPASRAPRDGQNLRTGTPRDPPGVALDGAASLQTGKQSPPPRGAFGTPRTPLVAVKRPGPASIPSPSAPTCLL